MSDHDDWNWCDAYGCEESHPTSGFPEEGEPGFTYGRWLGWVYLDLNRPDLFPRPLRFCSAQHLKWWIVTMEAEPVGNRKPADPLDVVLRALPAEIERHRAKRTRRSP